MERRSFLRFSVALLELVPLVRLRTEVDIESIMLRFCADEPYRLDLTQPFGVGPFTYATDTKHMVRAELVNRQENGERRLPKNVEEVWRYHWHPSNWVPFELPRIEDLTIRCSDGFYAICPLCDNRRISLGEWPPESFDKFRRLDYDPDDNSIRDKSCQLCRGKQYNGPSLAMVAGTLMSFHRLKPIAAIPGVEIAANQKGEDHPFLFRGSELEGMAMGLDPKVLG